MSAASPLQSDYAGEQPYLELTRSALASGRVASPRPSQLNAGWADNSGVFKATTS